MTGVQVTNVDVDAAKTQFVTMLAREVSGPVMSSAGGCERCRYRRLGFRYGLGKGRRRRPNALFQKVAAFDNAAIIIASISEDRPVNWPRSHQSSCDVFPFGAG